MYFGHHSFLITNRIEGTGHHLQGSTSKRWCPSAIIELGGLQKEAGAYLSMPALLLLILHAP